MSKIWETDFLSFSGSSSVLYDKVGTQHLTSITGTIYKTSLPEFIVRSGISFSKGVTYSYYNIVAATNAVMYPSGGYPTGTRSFVVWVYIDEPWNTAKWPGPTTSTHIWCQLDSNPTLQHGISIYVDINSIVYIEGRVQGAFNVIRSTITNSGWYCIILTVDAPGLESKLYINSSLIGTLNIVPSTYYINNNIIGPISDSNRGSFKLGRTTTYNHTLSQSEITAIYNDYLPDNLSDNYPYYTLSGTVFSAEGVVSPSGTKAYLLRETPLSIVDACTTSGDGLYHLNVPSSGNYTVITTNTPNSGASAVPIEAASGTVYFK